MTLSGHRRIALDSNVLIYLLEDHPQFGSSAGVVVDAIGRGDVSATISTIALVEILGGPAKSGDGEAFERMADAIRGLEMTVIALDAELATDAAWLHGSIGGTAADAIHLATARRSGATAFVTNDKRIRSIARLEVVYLDDIA